MVGRTRPQKQEHVKSTTIQNGDSLQCLETLLPLISVGKSLASDPDWNIQLMRMGYSVPWGIMKIMM